MSEAGKRLIASANGALDLVKASEVVGSLCDRIEQLERYLRLEQSNNVKFSREIERINSELIAEKALADQLHEELIRSGMVMSQFILNYRKARGL